MIPRMAIPIGNDEIVGILRSLVAGADALDDNVAEFENALATYVGSKKVFVFNSGRTALYSALQALNLKHGDEVIVPAYSCAVVFEVVLRLGLRPILVDVNLGTYNIAPELITKAISSKTKAIIPVHLFGRPCEMDEIMEIANKHSLYVIENVAQALGAEYKKVKVGTFGDLAIFSFGPGKSITSGKGGAMSVNCEELTEKVMVIEAKLPNPDVNWILHSLANIMAMKIFSNPYTYSLIRGLLKETLVSREEKTLENCLHLLEEDDKISLNPTVVLAKMPPLLAKIARMQLEKLDEFNQKRINNAMTLTRLLNMLGDFIELPETSGDVKNTFIRYPIRLLKGSRNKIMEGLLQQGVDTEKSYYYLVDLFESLKVKVVNASTIATSIFTVPNHPLMGESNIFQVAKVLSNQLVEARAQ